MDTRPFRWSGRLLLVLLVSSAAEAEVPERHEIAPERKFPASLEPFLQQVAPGLDEFPDEKEAEELSTRLLEMSTGLRRNPAEIGTLLEGFLAADFQGGRLTSSEETPLSEDPRLEVARARSLSTAPMRDRASFSREWTALLDGMERVDVAEFLVTSIDVKRNDPPSAHTTVRYDIVGSGRDAWRNQRVGHWEMTWRREAGGGWRVAAWRALDQLRSRATAPVFVEATGQALGANASLRTQLGPGHDAWLATLDSAFALDTMALHGISAADVDGDGRDDLYVSQPSGLPNRLFRNRGGGTFEDATEASGLGVLDSTSHTVFADVDNDGDEDAVLVVRSRVGLLLFTNDGRGHFTRAEGAFDFRGRLRGSPTAVALADYDRDGFVDVYLCTYSSFIGASEDKSGPANPYHDARNGPPNLLLRNDGRGRFADVTAALGLDENNDHWTLAAAWADYDQDGWPDLLVANDFGTKNLYHNEATATGARTFKDIAAKAGVLDHGAGMSATWLDYDHDGLLDIYTANMWTAAGLRVTEKPSFLEGTPEEERALFRRHARGNSLFRNRGDGTFEDVTLRTRTEMGRWAWSSDALDFDLDGWEDLYIMNGMFTRAPNGTARRELDSFFWRQVVPRSPLAFKRGTPYEDAWRFINRLLITDYGQASHERNVFLRGNPQGGFDDVSGTVGLDIDQDSRAFAILDYDGDGDPDVVTYAPRSSPQVRVLRNDFPEKNASVAVRLVGTKSARDAAGARVTVTTETGRTTKVLMLGAGFLSQSSKELIFGVGRTDRLQALTVEWPSGLRQVFSPIPARHRIFIEEGNEKVRTEPFTPSAPRPPAFAPVPVPPTTSVWLYEPYPAPDFSLPDLLGQEHTRAGLRGRPAVILLWSAAAPSSRTALAELAQQKAAIEKAGAAVLAFSLDASEDRSKVRQAAQGIDVAVAIAGKELTGALAIFHRFAFARAENLRVPTALLLDAAGDVVKVYRDRIDAAEILADVPRIPAGKEERLRRALAFSGTFVTPPEGRNYFQYALDLAEQGLESHALAAFERAAEQDANAYTLYNLGTLYGKAGRNRESEQAFLRALALRPDYAEANNSLGALLAQKGDVAGGVARFRAALAVRPDYADALNNLGFAYFQTGKEREAYQLYEKAIEVQPDFPEALNNLGIFFGQRDDIERAESYFRKAFEKRPTYGEAANNLALVLMAKGDSAGAIGVLRLLLQENPGFEMGYVSLARVFFETGRRREATQVVERLLQKNPTHPIGLQMARELGGAR